MLSNNIVIKGFLQYSDSLYTIIHTQRMIFEAKLQIINICMQYKI